MRAEIDSFSGVPAEEERREGEEVKREEERDPLLPREVEEDKWTEC